MRWGKLLLFAGGVLFGTAGIKVLSSRDAKKVAVLRAKDALVDQATVLQENCSDIYEEAKQINEKRAEAEDDRIIVSTEEA